MGKKVVAFLKKVADSTAFSSFIIGVIVLAGIVVGIETYGDIASRHATLLHALDAIILWIFVAEIVIKMGAHGRQPWRYFQDPWNIFDFSMVGY